MLELSEFVGALTTSTEPLLSHSSSTESRFGPYWATLSWNDSAPPPVVNEKTSRSSARPMRPLKLTLLPLIGSGEAVATVLP
jgi:hypothetical protein